MKARKNVAVTGAGDLPSRNQWLCGSHSIADAEADVVKIKELMAHASIVMTMRYI
jgi:hypothetical protein